MVLTSFFIFIFYYVLLKGRKKQEKDSNVLDEKLHTHIDKKILAFRYTHSHDEYSTRRNPGPTQCLFSSHLKFLFGNLKERGRKSFEGFRFSAIT